jgi:hypothetical protein
MAWHEADIPPIPCNIRSVGQAQHELFRLLSDPEGSCGVSEVLAFESLDVFGVISRN